MPVRAGALLTLFLLFSSMASASPLYRIFQDALDSAQNGRTPYAVLDFDDTLSRTGPRYVLALKSINKDLGLGLDNRRIVPSVVQYSDSFRKTIQDTLERLGVDRSSIQRIYTLQAGESISPAEQVFFREFFSEKNVGVDPFYKGAAFFLTNLLAFMKAVGGKVVIASGRADKYIELTRSSMQNAGVPVEFLNDRKLLEWQFKSSQKKLDAKGEVNLSFQNNKWEAVRSLNERTRAEVVAFVDNEFRNIVQMINRLDSSKVYFMRTVDATWSGTHMSENGFTAVERHSPTRANQRDLARIMKAVGAKVIWENSLSIRSCLRRARM